MGLPRAYGSLARHSRRSEPGRVERHGELATASERRVYRLAAGVAAVIRIDALHPGRAFARGQQLDREPDQTDCNHRVILRISHNETSYSTWKQD